MSKTDLGLVLTSFNERVDIVNTRGDINRYLVDSEESVYFNGVKYHKRPSEVISIQELFIETLRKEGLLRNNNAIIMSRFYKFFKEVKFGKLGNGAFILLDRELTQGYNLFLGIPYMNKRRLVEVLQNYIDSNNPHLYYKKYIGFFKNGTPLTYSGMINTLNEITK